MNNRFAQLFLSTLVTLILLVANSLAVQGEDGISLAVKPNKVLYKPGEKAVVNVTLVNSGSSDLKGTVVLREFRDIDTTRKVGSREVLVPAEKSVEASFEYEIGEDEYGREIRADFIQNGKTAAKGSEFFSVADKWLRVSMQVMYHLPPEYSKANWSDGYGNYFIAAYGGLPDNLIDLAPDEESWYNGFELWPGSKAQIYEYIKHYRALGIKMLLYTFSAGDVSGVSGFEFARRHPEYMIRTENGQFMYGHHSYFMHYNPMELAEPITTKMSNTYSATVDYYYPEVTKYIAEQILKSIDMFGWDGVWLDGINALRAEYSWDGEPTTHGQDPNKLAVRNVKLMRDILRRQDPNMPLGYNISTEFLNQKFETQFGNSGGWEAFNEVTSDDNTAVLQEWASRSWPKWYRRCVSDRDTVVQERGCILWHGCGTLFQVPSRDTKEWLDKYRCLWVPANHLGSIYVSTQVHPFVTTYAGNSIIPFTQFMTRYSKYLWAEDIRTIKNPQDLFEVRTSKELWWKEIAYKRSSQNSVEYILHFIQPPARQQVIEEIVEDPLPVEDLVVSFRLPESEKPMPEIWAMRAYETGEDKAPRQTKLKVTRTNQDSIEVRIPPFRYHTMVVLRFNGHD